MSSFIVQLFVILTIVSLSSCSDSSKEDSAPTQPPGSPQVNTQERHEIQLRVDESSYALKMANHVSKMKEFLSDDLDFSMCYEFEKEISNYRWNLMRIHDYDSDNEKAVKYLKELNNDKTKKGREYRLAFQHLLGSWASNNCPFVSIGAESITLDLERFKKSLSNYIDYMERTILAAQYGYVFEKEKSGSFVKESIYLFLYDIKGRYERLGFRLNSKNSEDDELDELVDSYVKYNIGNTLTELAHTRAWIHYNFEDIETTDESLYPEFQTKLFHLIALTNEIDILPKKTRSDLLYLNDKMEYLSEVAGKYLDEYSEAMGY